VNKIEKTLFIKPAQPVFGEAILNLNRVIGNKVAGIETTLILDTNVLIRIEHVVKNGNKKSLLKPQGLQNLVEFIARCPAQSICLSPGQSLYEMPPLLAERAKEAFDAFCEVHLPGFVDAPNCIRKKFDGPKASYSYFDLPYDVQAAFGHTFTSLLLLQIVDRSPIKDPIEKFREYLRRIVTELDLLSDKEIEIAKYCFAVPPPHCRDLINFRREIRANFLQKKDGSLPKTVDESVAVAFNGARDLYLLNAANVSDSHGLDGVPQDCWIATQDKKLAAFSKMVHNIQVDGEAGKYSAVVRHPDSEEDLYWLEADAEHRSLVLSRSLHHEQRKIDFEIFVQAAFRVTEEVRQLMG